MGELRIVVPGEYILDGMCAFPLPGDRAEYSLAFRERTASTNPVMLNDARAEAEPPRNNRCTPGWTDPDGSFQTPTYAMFLHNADFTAFFRSPELLRGPVVLRGTLEADWPAVIGDPPPVRGTIARCRLVTRTTGVYPIGEHRTRIDTLTDLDGPVGFRSGLVPAGPPGETGGRNWVAMVPPEHGEWTSDSGVLVTLSIST